MTIKAHKKSKNSPRKPRKEAVSVSINDEKETPLLMPKKTESSSFSHQDFNGASFIGAVFNLSTTIIGAGIMALPATMKVLGLGLGIALIVFVAVLTEFSVGLLLRFSKAGGSASYAGVMGDAFGDVGRRILQVCVVINNIGVLIVYMIIIGDVLSGSSSSGVHHAGILEGWFGEHWWNGRFFVLVVTTLGVFTPLACFKRIDSLRHTSALAVFLAFVFLLITATIAVAKWLQGTTTIPRFLPDVTDINSVWALFTVVPVLVQHMSAISMLNDIVRVSYALHLMLVFPVIFYPLRLNLDGFLFPSSVPLVTDNIRFSLLTAGLISVAFLGANFIPSIWDAFQFTGATTAVCIGFIFPAAIALRNSHGITSWKDKTLAIFMVGLAVFASLVAIYSDAYAIFKKNASPSRE
ncbi:Amino acid transporter AVT6A [Sesamum angolense]|uniref:Amino acid transporter AVT6A n=1 Tax=Sesamum angolense TaxID=2727404 RepID=A0AAE1VUQ8_9LAMI|nr:Amino acid transporter AVT6A [Sesamum angolense]